MSNWAENPNAKKQSLMSYSLPSLLFSECQKYCIEGDFGYAETAQQKTCLSNCQDKTYKAFELYISV